MYLELYQTENVQDKQDVDHKGPCKDESFRRQAVN